MRKILVIFLFCFVLGAAQAQDKRPTVAVVLAGGGARGFAHIAVLELIEELGIPIDMVAGVSSGSIVAGLYAAGYSPAMIMETLENRDWSSFFQDRPVSPFWNRSDELPIAFSLGGPDGPIAPDWDKGYSTGQRVYEFFKSLTVKIPSYINFDDLSIPFRAGTVEVPSGKFYLLDSGDIAEALRASMSIQGVFEPFIINGHSFVDGGLLNTLPVKEVRDLGFDIVIAVNLWPPPPEYNTDPVHLADLMNAISSDKMSSAQNVYADVVLYPLPHEVPFMGFEMGPEIYAMVKQEWERLAVLLKPVQEKTAAEGTPVLRRAAFPLYKNIQPLAPQKIIIEGALPRDRSFIEKQFSRYLMGKNLDENNITAFLESIYETGNYSKVIARTDIRSGVTCLELILYPEAENKILLRLGMNYDGTFTWESFTQAALRSGIEYQDKNGLSLLLNAGVLDELSLGLSMFLPLSPYFFLAAEAELVREQELAVQGFLSRKAIAPERLLYFRGIVKGLLRINRNNSFTFWPEYFWFLNDEDSYSIAGIAADYTYSNLNHVLFPSRGFRGRAENHIRFTGDLDFFDLASIDLSAAIPLGSRFSFVFSFFGSSVFGNPNLPSEIADFDNGNIQRVYFPHVFGIFSGEKRLAFSLSLQAEPKKNLTILGSRLVLFLTSSAGRAGPFKWNNWTDFKNDELIWNACLGAALVPINNIGFQIRAGAGGGNGHNTAPFVSVDIGLSGFQKRLF